MKKPKQLPIEAFLIRKYKSCLAEAINKLGNRGFDDDFAWKDNNFNLRNKIQKQCDELIIDEKELFSEFIQIAKSHNMHDINPHIFVNALDDMINKLSEFPGMWIFEDFRVNFFIEKQKIGKSCIYKVIFGPN